MEYNYMHSTEVYKVVEAQYIYMWTLHDVHAYMPYYMPYYMQYYMPYYMQYCMYIYCS